MTIDSAAPRRGRKRYDDTKFAFPIGEEFLIKDLAKKHGVSVPFVHLRMKEAGAKITKKSEIKVAGQKGRAAGVYIYNEQATLV